MTKFQGLIQSMLRAWPALWLYFPVEGFGRSLCQRAILVPCQRDWTFVQSGVVLFLLEIGGEGVVHIYCQCFFLILCILLVMLLFQSTRRL